MFSPELLPWVVTGIAAGIAAAIDLRSFRIPNWLTLSLMGGGIAYFSVNYGWIGLAASLVGASAGLLPLLPLYVLGGMGAGDLKLMAGLGTWLHFTATLEVLAISCLLTALVSLAILLHRRLSETGSEATTVAPAGGVADPPGSITKVRVEQVTQLADRRRRVIPFGVMVAIGLVVTLARHHW